MKISVDSPWMVMILVLLAMASVLITWSMPGIVERSPRASPIPTLSIDDDNDRAHKNRHKPKKYENEESELRVQPRLVEKRTFSSKRTKNIVDDEEGDTIAREPEESEEEEGEWLGKEAVEHERNTQNWRKERRAVEHVEHFFVHIPKAAGSQARNSMNRLYFTTSPPPTTAHAERGWWLCDHGTEPYEEHPHWTTTIYLKKWGGVTKNCSVHMSEAIYPPASAATTRFYTIVRPPHEHVLSQYFHCTESRNHRNREVMPSLTAWLHEWVHRSQSEPVPHATDDHVHSEYNCYDPIDLQSHFLGHTGSSDDLRARFRFIGLTTHFYKSVCAIFVLVNHVVPPDCDCTDGRNGLTTRKKVRLGRGTQHGGETHGVLHHGASFQATRTQRQAIWNLTGVDRNLWTLAEDRFAYDVGSIEEDYGVRLCDDDA